MKRLAIALALASLAASVGPAGARTAAASQPEVRPDTLIDAQWGRPPWAACRRWRRGVCWDAGWRGRNWQAWSGRPTCGPGHRWWIDRRGRWRRC
jgi:hypothetical protein